MLARNMHLPFFTHNRNIFQRGHAHLSVQRLCDVKANSWNFEFELGQIQDWVEKVKRKHLIGLVHELGPMLGLGEMGASLARICCDQVTWRQIHTSRFPSFFLGLPEKYGCILHYMFTSSRGPRGQHPVRGRCSHVYTISNQVGHIDRVHGDDERAEHPRLLAFDVALDTRVEEFDKLERNRGERRKPKRLIKLYLYCNNSTKSIAGRTRQKRRWLVFSHVLQRQLCRQPTLV